MYKIKFIPTGHVFILPENEAERLKKQNKEKISVPKSAQDLIDIDTLY